jgi:membrane-associated phospholipid phosphatase
MEIPYAVAMQPHWPDALVFRQNSRRLWWGIVLVMVTAGIGILATGLSVDLRSNPTLLILIAAYAATTFFYRFIRFDERLSNALTAVAQLLLIVLFGLLCSYAATVIGMPYRDAELLAIDQWLGFDRRSYVNLFTDSPWKVHLSNFVYLAMMPQLAVVPLALILTSRMQQLQRFIAAYGIALISTIAIFVLVPAVGAFVYFDLTPDQYAALPKEIYTPARTLDALRSGAGKTIRLDDLEGLIAFPSFHTAAGILYAWALWPVKSIRWPIAALNVAMISTTPICGAHYAIDVVAGAIVAIGSIAASRLICRSKIALAVAPMSARQTIAAHTVELVLDKNGR